MLRHPAAAALHDLPVWKASAALAVLVGALAAAIGRLRGATLRHLAAAAVLVAVGFALVRLPSHGRAEARSGVRVVLGLDSLSRRDAGEELRRMALARGGTWYARAVTPGLLTNVVWLSLVTSHRPSEIGVFFTFQSPDWTHAPAEPRRSRPRRGAAHRLVLLGSVHDARRRGPALRRGPQRAARLAPGRDRGGEGRGPVPPRGPSASPAHPGRRDPREPGGDVRVLAPARARGHLHRRSLRSTARSSSPTSTTCTRPAIRATPSSRPSSAPACARRAF